MSIFKEARPQMAYLKMGIYGEAGTGKSFTSSLTAIGLHKHIKSDKPIFFMDTETGSDFVRHIFDGEKIALQVAKTRAFKDLVSGIDEIPEGSILIIDSITHYWNELIESFMTKNNLTRLALKHWQPLKATWREFTNRYVGSKIHIILAGRSADKWGEIEDEDGSKELKKVGTKMRTETEMGYEPSLLVEMTAIQLSPQFGGKVVRQAFIKKDRFDIMDGQIFTNPTFETFLPHISKLNLGGEHVALEPGRDSTELFNNDNIGERKAIRREILVEKIENAIKKLYPGQTERDKLARISLMETTFETNSWKELSTFLTLDKLEFGLQVLEDKIASAVAELVAADAVVDQKAAPAPAPDPGDGKHSRKGARA